MKFGKYDVRTVLFGRFRLDGGAMFGSVPKNLWAKRIPADNENCIPMAARALLVRGEGRVVLVDVGLGEKWAEKPRKIFEIKNEPSEKLGFAPESVTDIILTHLHFDHAGGISRWKDAQKKEAELTYPKAKMWLQRSNFENARNPNPREQASYLPENVFVLEQGDLTLVEGSREILPDLWVHRFDGHTVGQQWIELRDGARRIMYPADLVPTSHHLPVPFVMGYDMCASTALHEKEEFLKRALDEDALIVFEHDPAVAAARIAKPAHYVVRESFAALD